MASRARSSSFMSERVAAAYSTSAKKKTLPIKTQMAVVNWENVLVPMDWMVVHLGLEASADAARQAALRCQHTPYLQRSIAALEERVMDLLAKTMESIKGPVVITSAYSTVFVEYVSSLFFPRLTAALRNATTGIYVVGTPNTTLTIDELMDWKVNLMHTAIFEKLFAGADVKEAQRLLNRPTSGKIGIVALCATEIDVSTTSAVLSIAPNAIVKRVKVNDMKSATAKHLRGCPMSLEDFYTQLSTLTAFVQHAAASTNCISISL
ncbi:Protein unc-50 [Phytophthora boehmeriae]|uniref:Protein unc-50 n=1 Tax=Phytophthora boehmeriae TaxID=109152 RepID=A0A8T1WV34_9STRA|nr:Protein unc-50 [Phytophthora boehmeriae]